VANSGNGLRNAVLILVAAAFIGGCGEQDSAAGIGSSRRIVYPPPGISLIELDSAHVVSRDAPSTLAFAIDADAATGRLVVLDYHAEQPVVVMEATGDVVARVGARGQGPHEFQDVGFLSVSDGIASVWDRALGRVGEVSIEEPTEVSTQRLPIPEGKRVLEIARLTSGQYIVAGVMGDVLAAKVRPPLFSDSAPNPAAVEFLGQGAVQLPGTTDAMRAYLSEASIAVNEDRDIIALGYQDTGEMVFARLSTGEVMKVTRPGRWPEPTLAPVERSGVVAQAPSNFVGYRSVRQSADGVWGLFVGNTWDKSFGPVDNRDVHAYDWSGQLQAILRLPIEVDDVAVLGNNLYGATNELVPAIVSWEVPESVLGAMRNSRQ